MIDESDFLIVYFYVLIPNKYNSNRIVYVVSYCVV